MTVDILICVMGVGAGVENTTSGVAVPVVDVADVVITDATLAGCALAGALVAQGRRVVLNCTGASPGREIALAYRAWITPRERHDLPEPLGTIVDRAANPASDGDDGHVLLDLAAFTTGLEDWLIDCGVRLVYDQTPTGVVRDAAGTVCGVLLAGKAGLVAVIGGQVIDATEAATLAQICAGPLAPAEPVNDGDGRLERDVTVGWYMRDVPEGSTVCRPAPDVHGEGRGPWWRWTFRMEVDPREPDWPGRVALTVRRRILEIAPRVRAVPGWNDACWVRGADVLTLPQVLRSPAQLPDGLHLLGPAAVSGSPVLANDGPGTLWRSGAALADALGPVERPAWHDDPRALERHLASCSVQAAPEGEGEPFAPDEQASCGDPRYPLGRHRVVRWDGRTPREPHVSVLVNGGGTSGMPAGAEAASRGLSTLLLEKHADLGGTNTVGGVSTYWYGRKTRYVGDHDAHLKQHADSAGVCASLAKLDVLLRSGAAVRLRCVAAGVIVQGRRLTDVVVTTSRGLMRQPAGQFLDASGDGDLPAWAGHDYTYGIERDEATMWYSFGKFVGAKPSASREYFSVVDLRDPHDLTGAIIASRRRDGIYGRGDVPQFYLAPREGRHILGRATVTYRDLLRGVRPADTVLICRANFDIKGPASSDLAMAGFVEPDFHRNYDCAVPYGAMVPRDLDNVLVLGKAYSATHDALALARMQRDMIAMGGVAGCAAALARDGALSDVDAQALQRQLIEAGILLREDLIPAPTRDAATLIALLDAGPLDDGGACDEINLATLNGGALDLAPQIHVLDLLKDDEDLAHELCRRLDDTNPVRRHLAAGLLYAARRHPAARDLLLHEIDQALARETLPDLHVSKARHDRPDHGWAPWPCCDMNLLAQGGETQLVPRLIRLADRLAPDPSRSDKWYHYIETLAYGAERLAHPDCAPILKRVLAQPWLGDVVLQRGDDSRQRVDHIRERYAYLRLSLARALARCGDQAGHRELVVFLDDQRAWLARSAWLELLTLAGDTGPCSADPGNWARWLDECLDAQRPFAPQPYPHAHH